MSEPAASGDVEAEGEGAAVSDDSKRVTRERYVIGSHFMRNRWFVNDTATDEPVSEHKTREAAIAAADRLNAALPAEPAASGDVPTYTTRYWRRSSEERVAAGLASQARREAASGDVEAARENVLVLIRARDIGATRLDAFGAAIRAEGLDVERLAHAACLEAESIESDPVDFADCPDRAEHIEYAATLAAEYARLAEAER